MPNGTPVAGNVWPSPAVPIMGFTESAGVTAGAAATAWPARTRKNIIERIGFTALPHRLNPDRLPSRRPQRRAQHRARIHGTGLYADLGTGGRAIVVRIDMRRVFPTLGQKREWDFKRAGLAGVDRPDEPLVPLLARDGRVLTDLALNDFGLIPHRGDVAEELDLWLVLVIRRLVVPEDPLHRAE